MIQAKMQESAESQTEATVYIVDDDPVTRDSLVWLVESAGLRSESYADAADFLSNCRPDEPGCAVLDVRMPGIGGVRLMAAMRGRGIDLPVIFVTAYAAVQTAVELLKSGALDYVEKPFPPKAMLERIQQGIAQDRDRRQAKRREMQIARRLARLSPREREVMNRIAAGQANKVVAAELGISERTVEVHRRQVMLKTGVASLAELVRLLCSREPESRPTPARPHLGAQTNREAAGFKVVTRKTATLSRQ